MRGQFTFYRSFWDAVKRLKKKDDRLSILEAIAAYALDEEELPMTDAAEALFILIKPNLETAAKKSKGGKTGERQTEDKGKTSARQTKDKHKEKEGEIEKKNECYSARARVVPRFSPPTVDDVDAYCRERQNGIDAQQFVDFYTSKGWKVGNAPMKDWRAAVRTWEQRKQTPGGGGNGWRFEDL